MSSDVLRQRAEGHPNHFESFMIFVSENEDARSVHVRDTTLSDSTEGRLGIRLEGGESLATLL